MTRSDTPVEPASASFENPSLGSLLLDPKIQSLARSPLPLFLIGEEGVGKATTARRMHGVSRPDQRLVWINCRLPEPELTVELFGCRKDPSCDRPLDRPGKMLMARQGTLYLDGAEGIPTSIRDRLGEYLRNAELGIRLIASLEKTAHRPTPWTDWGIPFGAVSLEIPPLRRRRNEIPYFCHLFFQNLSRRYGYQAESLPEGAHPALPDLQMAGEPRRPSGRHQAPFRGPPGGVHGQTGLKQGKTGTDDPFPPTNNCLEN